MDAAAEPDPAARIVRRLRAALGGATFVMLGLSWPLWTAPDTVFPHVPFVRGAAWPDERAAVAWLVYAALLVAVGAGAFLLRGWTWAVGTSLALLLGLVVQDQHRLQPWVYEHVTLGLLLLGLGAGRAVRYARWWFAGLYLHSALSKLDVSFVREMGAVFLAALARPLGTDPTAWPERWRGAAILAMPVGEALVALLLVLPRTRRIGLIGALALHAALVAILGPWGLAHSTIVVVWNVAMMIELCVLFGPEVSPGSHHVSMAQAQRDTPPRPPFARGGVKTALPAHWATAPRAEAPPLAKGGQGGSNGAQAPPVGNPSGLRPKPTPAAPQRDARLAPVVTTLFWCALVAPLGEPWGLLDAWPGHALYASHVERTAVYLHDAALDAYPAAVRGHLVGPAEGPWHRLDLTGWSRAVRGTPVYPSGRACNGLAEALAARYGGPHPVRVLQWGRADRWTGRRPAVECLGLNAIRRQGDRYWVNAHPAPAGTNGVRRTESND